MYLISNLLNFFPYYLLLLRLALAGNIWKWGYTLLFLLVFNNAAAQEKYSQVKVYAANPEQRAHLMGLLQVDHFYEEEGAFISEVGAGAIRQLQAAGARYEILVDDVVKNLHALNQQYYADRARGLHADQSRVAIEQHGRTIDAIIRKPDAFQVKSTFGGYYSFAEMNAAMDALVAAYPAIVTKTSIGKTYENRDIWVIKISDNAATDEPNEPEVLYLGLQHPREAITGASMIFFMQYLAENYAADSRIRDLVDNREFFIIPCFNPDGYEYNRTSMSGNAGGSWRKNRAKTGASTYGVDLNRNWGVDWGNCSAPISGPAASCGSSDKTQETYWGTAAFSELETQAVRAFTKAHHIVAGFDQHAYGPYYSLPFGRKALHTMSAKGQQFYTAVPALMGTYNGMRAADSYDALGYEVAGGFKDWMLMGELGSTSGTGRKDTVWAMTGEGAAGGGTSGFGSMASFWAPASQIISLSKGMCYQNLQLAYAAGTYVDIQDANDIALHTVSGSLKFTIKRLGLGNDPVKVTLVPLENIAAAGSAVTVGGLPYYGSHTGSIGYNLPPALITGQRIRYAWKVETGGYTYSDTVVRFYKPTTLFADDMEGADVLANWTVSGGWNYATDRAYGGTKALTESPGANYTASSTRIATYKGTLDLSNAYAAFLTFWTRHRAENFRDKLQVQVSVNGTTWVPIRGRTTIAEPGTLDGSTLNGQPALTGIRDYWTQEMFDLSAYNGTPALRFRFVFTSDNDPSSFKFEVDEGFYIDNLLVMKSTAAISLLPVHFISCSGTVQPDQTVRISWSATASEQHAYFEVQRSDDGTHFTSLGKAGNGLPYQFVDGAPGTGDKLYRIRQVDKSGNSTYSRTISLTLAGPVRYTFFPNPVQDQLSISLAGSTPLGYRVQLTDLQGRVLYQKDQQAASATSSLRVDMAAWKPAVYILKVVNNENAAVTTQKILKY